MAKIEILYDGLGEWTVVNVDGVKVFSGHRIGKDECAHILRHLGHSVSVAHGEFEDGDETQFHEDD